MEVDINEVLVAIDTLYDLQPQDRQKHDQASQWLGQLQRSVQAWKVADQLLHTKRDVNSCFFAAQTLRTKIQLYFGELPVEAHASLRASMLEHLCHITEHTYQGIATQLCVALADLALHMASWEDPIGDLISQLGPGASSPNLVPLLEVLIALPEELHSRQLRLGLNRRKQLDEYFRRKVPSIIELLHVAVGTEGASKESTHLKALRCLASWFNIHTEKWVMLTNTCLVNDILSVVRNPQVSPRLHEIATDCICSAMIMLEAERIQPLAEVLFAGVLQLGEPYHLAVALEDLNAITNYARIFSELGETLVEVMVDQPGQGMGSLQVLHLLLTCIGHHDWEVAEITFNFWYKLSEVLYRKNCDNVNEQFKPYVERLIEALYRHCQIEPDHENILLQQDDFYEFRERVQELIKDVVFICGSKPCFQQMSNILQAPDVTKSWNLLEAALFIMQSVAKNLVPIDNYLMVQSHPREENEVVPPILEAVLKQPDEVHMQVAFTSVQLLAELNEWIACHPDVLPLVLQFLTKRLHNKHLATVAAKALDAICQSCRDHIEQHFEGLMQIIESLDSFSISNEAVVGLLKGVASILGRFPPERIKTDMKKLCLSQVRNLQKLMEENTPIEKNTKSDPVVWLDRLAAIFRNVNPIVQNGEQHPCQEVVMEVWPTLSMTFQRYSSDLRVMEHCCRSLRFAVRCVHQQSAPLLSPLVEQIVGLYATHGHSCFLYLGSILVDEYAGEPGCVIGLLAMLEAFTQPTFVLLTQPSGFRNHPDTVDDWFRLCARFLQRAPVAFLQCSALNTILECGLQACMLDHKDANAAVLKFFQDLVEAGRKHEDRPDFETRRTLVVNIFNTHGENLVSNLITAAIFILPQYMHHDVAETFYQIMQFDRPKFCLWLEAKLKVLPTKNSGGVEAVTQAQLVEFHKAVTQAERPKEITRALVEFSRFFS
ncbi:transportin-3-like isoform X2 [Penaeus japonicus]|uniref:transportin-3-like isoform X2 n=1 Tax=Penaeus japonicus TaxID=27405 RepID=UPI001C7131DA|nr:transportin-3-like isoform X2 [Penaeus japonicus]